MDSELIQSVRGFAADPMPLTKIRRTLGYRINRKCIPSKRVAHILERLSRDKFIPPDDLRPLAWQLCQMASRSPSMVQNAAVEDSCLYTGMFKGQPVRFICDPEYSLFVKGLKGLKTGPKAELKLLELEVTARMKRRKK